MATIREWLRDFRKKPKWDKFSILFTIIVSAVGLFFGGLKIYYYFNNTTINDSSSFSIINSSEFGFNYKSPNSPINITTRTEYYSDSCDSKIYKNTIRYTPDGYYTESKGAKYNLNNVMVNLPSGQTLFVEKLEAGKEYLLGYTNDNYSSICISHQYRISTDFDSNRVCFFLSLKANYCGDPGSQLNLEPGIKYIKDKTPCFVKIEGDSMDLENWCS